MDHSDQMDDWITYAKKSAVESADEFDKRGSRRVYEFII